MTENNQAINEQAAIEAAKKIEHVVKKMIKADAKDAIQVIFSVAKYAEKYPEKYNFLKKQLFKSVK